MKERYALSQMRKQANRMTFGEIEQDAYQADLGFTTGQLGKGGVTGPVRGPTVDKKTEVSISKRLHVSISITVGNDTFYLTTNYIILKFLKLNNP